MNNELVGSYWILTALPIWATAFLLYVLTIGVLFVLRDKCEGLFYNTSYAAMLGDGALIVAVLMSAGILQRVGDSLSLPGQFEGKGIHIFAACFGLFLGIMWFALDSPQQWGDRYHHLVIAPLLCYLGITLLPVIFKNGTRVEVVSTICLIAIWAVLVVYDAKTHRLDQRNYHNLGRYIDAMICR